MPVSREAWAKAQRAARLSNRPARELGEHRYAIQGDGLDAHGQPNIWHVDLNDPEWPTCDCPAFLRDPQCKHIVYFQFVESVMVQRRPAGESNPALPPT